MDDQKRRDEGMARRRKVLGNAWVDKANAGRNSFNSEFQDLITRYAWNEVWTRAHFDERTRRSPKAASRPTISRKSSCSRRSIAACPPPTTP
jgi:hypothetical protein